MSKWSLLLLLRHRVCLSLVRAKEDHFCWALCNIHLQVARWMAAVTRVKSTTRAANDIDIPPIKFKVKLLAVLYIMPAKSY